MDIETLEINLFKASEIKDEDIILVKIDAEQKKDFSKDNIESLYKQLKSLIKKDIGIYFFPKNIDINLIKNHIELNEKNKEQIIEKAKELDKNEN